MNQPLLELRTLIDRPKIVIDARPHELLSPEELPVLTSQRLAAQGRQMQALMDQPSLSTAEGDELKRLVAAISDTIMEPVPGEVRAKLSDAQRLSVVEAFTMLLLSKKTGTAAALIKGLVPSSTGASSSPGFSASTAGTPATGSPRRRSRS